jgi:hypothetical protein
MEKCVQVFKDNNPERFELIEKLYRVYMDEFLYDCHSARLRDGSESDRQDSIRQSSRVEVAWTELQYELKSAYFEYTVRDVLRDHGNEADLTLEILLHRKKYYGETGLTVISDSKIGFEYHPLDSNLLIYHKT